MPADWVPFVRKSSRGWAAPLLKPRVGLPSRLFGKE
jgi:hypothetical protein